MEEPVITASGERFYQRVLPLMGEDAENGWFGRFFCDAIASMMQGLDDIVLDQTINGVEYPGWCTIAAPAVCPDAWLPWCGSIYGVPLPPGISASEQRAIIQELPPQKRGGIEAMRKAAEASYPVGGGFKITLTERAAGKAYAINAHTTPEQTAPEEAVTLAALLSQKPGGMKLIYTSADVPRWEDATLKWDEVEAGVTWAGVKIGDV
jgi:hypothetical protein